MKRIAITVLCLLLTAALLAGCVFSAEPFAAEKQEFSSNGMSITLTKGFKETSQQGYTVCFDSSRAAVFALKEEFTLAEGLGDLTLKEYCDLVFQSNADKSPEHGDDINGNPTMIYQFYNEDTKVEYHYLAVMYKASDAFWLVQFACDVEHAEEYEPYFIEAAKTVTFAA